MKPDKDRNHKVYGKSATAKSILLEHQASPPQEAKAYLRTLNKNADRG